MSKLCNTQRKIIKMHNFCNNYFILYNMRSLHSRDLSSSSIRVLTLLEYIFERVISFKIIIYEYLKNTLKFQLLM